MPLAEKIKQKVEGMKEKMAEKSQKSEKGGGVEIDSGEWLLLVLASLFADIIFVLLTIIGALPFIGQVFYALAEPIFNLFLMSAFWFYLQHKGLGHYWWLATSSWFINLVPVLNWIGWTVAIIILYFLVKAEKVPLAGEALEKATKTAAKIK